MADYPIKHLIHFPEGDTAEMREVAQDVFCCPVCGYPDLALMYSIPGREAWDHTFCPLCETEFGYEDAITREQVQQGFDHKACWTQLRKRWLAQKEITEQIRQQLKNIDVALDSNVSSE